MAMVVIRNYSFLKVLQFPFQAHGRTLLLPSLKLGMYIICFGWWNETRSRVSPLRETLKTHMHFTRLSFSSLNSHSSSKIEPCSLGPGMRTTWADSSSWPMMEQYLADCKDSSNSPPILVHTPPFQRDFATTCPPPRDGVHFYTPWTCSAVWLALANGIQEDVMERFVKCLYV